MKRKINYRRNRLAFNKNTHLHRNQYVSAIRSKNSNNIIVANNMCKICQIKRCVPSTAIHKIPCTTLYTARTDTSKLRVKIKVYGLHYTYENSVLFFYIVESCVKKKTPGACQNILFRSTEINHQQISAMHYMQFRAVIVHRCSCSFMRAL